jgi:hypothetical protein
MQPIPNATAGAFQHCPIENWQMKPMQRKRHAELWRLAGGGIVEEKECGPDCFFTNLRSLQWHFTGQEDLRAVSAVLTHSSAHRIRYWLASHSSLLS